MICLFTCWLWPLIAVVSFCRSLQLARPNHRRLRRIQTLGWSLSRPKRSISACCRPVVHLKLQNDAVATMSDGWFSDWIFPSAFQKDETRVMVKLPVSAEPVWGEQPEKKRALPAVPSASPSRPFLMVSCSLFCLFFFRPILLLATMPLTMLFTLVLEEVGPVLCKLASQRRASHGGAQFITTLEASLAAMECPVNWMIDDQGEQEGRLPVTGPLHARSPSFEAIRKGG